ncbi:MAG: hypothetical protein ACM3TN_24560 [Alphaproteobacteria bacterium]
MPLICEHCDEIIVGNPYRVTSEEDGVILLNMIVCSICAMEAKQLQLHTEVVDAKGAKDRASTSAINAPGPVS